MSFPRAPLSFTLVHYPIRNKKGEDIATAVTNLDIHDGSRLAATYGMEHYFLVTPIEEQRSLVCRIRDHWITGPGTKRNPQRQEGMKRVEHANSVEDACEFIANKHHVRPLLVGTSAKATGTQAISYSGLRQKIAEEDQPILLLFGTGWGLSPSLHNTIDLFLPPIWGPTNYNHLSVRAAMAITLDRLLGDYEPRD